MPRIKFKKIGQQVKFLLDIQDKVNIGWLRIAEELKIHPRTLYDWRRGKYNISKDAFNKLLKIVKEKKVTVPLYEVLPDYWNIPMAAKKGGIVTAKKYGGPGTFQGRRKGGKNSQVCRRLYPDLYQNCNLRKEILIPRKDRELAEFIGIILGDGGISSDLQVVITLHKENDANYCVFVVGLIKKLFNIKPAVYHYHSLRKEKVLGITISSANLIDFLKKQGLKKGSKVRNQADIPKWIKKNLDFSKNCLRGLIDTDGGVYYHRHRSQNRECFNIGLCFTNKSLPLIFFVKDVLTKLGFHPKVSSSGFNVVLYRESEILRYVKEVEFNNKHHIRRLKEFYKIKRKGARAV